MPETEETMASTAKQSTFTVREPFDSDSGADVVLISCDGSQFRARKAILSFVSPVFNDMFSLPQSKLPQSKPDDAQDGTTIPVGLPVVHLSETGLVIDTLLRYCYPLVEPVRDVDILAGVLDAADKYDMQYVIQIVESDLKAKSYSRLDALLVLYRRACDQHQEASARQHALNSLEFPNPLIVKDWGTTNVVGALSNLINYHQAVFVAISDYITDFWRVGSKGNDMWGDCHKCKRKSFEPSEPSWWTNGLISRVQNIFKEGPTAAQLLPSEEDIESLRCRSCSGCVHGKWKNFEVKFRLAIEEEVNRVELVLPW